MKSVSNKWNEMYHEHLVSESFVEVTLDITDPDAQHDATSSDNGAIYISNSSQIVSEVDKNIVPYSTLERNLWLLDGSKKIIPTSNYGDTGFISNSMSNASGVFSTIPTITINFSKTHTKIVPALTITWSTTYNEYPREFTLYAYRDNTIVAQKTITDNTSLQTIVELDMINYNRIVIQIKKWCLPNRRARVEEIFIGLRKAYDKNDLITFKHSQAVDGVSTSLPKSEVKFSISNAEFYYNFFEPTNSLTKYLMERQEVKVRFGHKIDNSIEWIKAGTFYLSEWNVANNHLVADFTARDLLEFMQNTYTGGTYNASGVSFYDLAISLLESANLPLNSDGTVKYLVDESLKNIITTAPLPEDTYANNLLLIANAGNCLLYQDENGILTLSPMREEMSTDEIVEMDAWNLYSAPEIELSKPIKQINVKVYRYYLENDEVKSEVVNEVVIPNSEDGEIITVDNPLITNDTLATTVGENVQEYYSYRTIYRYSFRANPILDAMDLVFNPYGVDGSWTLLTNIEYSYNGAFKATAEGRVFV